MKISVSPINFIKPTRQLGSTTQNSPSFAGKPPKVVIQDTLHISATTLRRIKKEKLIMENLRITNFRTVNAKCISGATFADRPLVELKSLRDFGFDTIIDFRGEASPHFQKQCKKRGLNYYNFNFFIVSMNKVFWVCKIYNIVKVEVIII